MRALWPAVAVTAAVLALGAATGAGSDRLTGAQSDTVAPGFDLFETDPEQTVFRFQGQTAIPANFFGQGSAQFQGDVQFGGVPLERFMNKDTGNADTVVQRPEAAPVAPAGAFGEPVPIELVQLSLVSVAPIEVVYENGNKELWGIDAGVSPTRPSRGQIAVERGNPRGGGMQSRLTVYPRFTFTRLSDRQTRQLDVGALPDGQRPEVTLQALLPWRDGCVPPALAVRGLNDGFCAGQTPEGETPVIVEQAPEARHGVRPAQPMLEHFKCYSGKLAKGSTFQKRVAELTDQFGTAQVEVVRPLRLCNPVQKNKERFRNKKAHLQCYVTNGKVPDGPPKVSLRNQFGSFSAELRRADRLCIPSSKQLAGQKKPKGVVFTDHFQCYAIKVSGQFPTPAIRLKDQFVSRKVKLGDPFRLCAPAQKNNERARHPVQHLACYRITTHALQKVATVRNQYGRLKYITDFGRELCVPTIKVRG